jgi:hypothetical protein
MWGGMHGGMYGVMYGGMYGECTRLLDQWFMMVRYCYAGSLRSSTPLRQCYDCMLIRQPYQEKK